MLSSGKKGASTSPKKLVYEVETIDSIVLQTPNKVGEEEDDYDKRFREFWGELPKSLSEIRFGEGKLGRGRPLVEVLEVHIISNSRKKHKLNINGTIIIDSAYGKSDLFRRTRENSEVIRSKDTLTMMGPHTGSVAFDFAEVEIDIKDGRRELCKGLMCLYDFHNAWDDMYGRLLSREITGKNGMGRVTYAIFRCAIPVQVEIKLPRIDVFNFELSRKIDTVKIYGRIDASITREATINSLTTTLFRRKHTSSVFASAKGGSLPLSKTLVAFPLGGTLEITLDLKEHLPCSSGNSIIVQDVAEVSPKQFGIHKRKFDSKYGPIEVKVTAYPTYMHPNTFAAIKESYRIVVPKFNR